MKQPIRLADVRWLLIRAADVVEGNLAPSGGRVKCAAPQGVCYAPGTIHEAETVARILSTIGKAMPRKDEVKLALQQHGFRGSHYALHEDGELWHLRCVSAREDPAAAFAELWTVVFEVGGHWVQAALDGDVAEVLRLFAMLNGQHDLQEVTAFCAAGSSPGCARLLALLAEVGLLEHGATPETLASVPDLCFLGHAGLSVRSGDDLVMFDPMLTPDNARVGGAHHATLLGHASAIVLSHCHWDHVHPQTLVRVPRAVPILVPRRAAPASVMNPSVADYLRALGFLDVREHVAGDVVRVGDLEVRFWPFHGEPFGLDSVFDGLTYTVTVNGVRLYGAVDALRNERADMERTIARVAAGGPIDLFLFGSTGQRHDPLYAAAGYRHFSNELARHPELHRYHPQVEDVLRWADVLRPRMLVPYAQFVFEGRGARTYTLDDRLDTLGAPPRGQQAWFESLRWLRAHTSAHLLHLHPGEGVRLG